MTPLDSLAALVRGRVVVVVGSAPLTEPLAFDEPVLWWPVNGGISSVPPGPVDVWNVNAREHEPHFKEGLHKLMLQQAAGREVTLALLNCRDEAPVPVFLGKMQRQGTAIGGYLGYTSLERDTLLQQARAFSVDMSRTAPSAGLFSIAMACYCGATRVHVRGLSWKPGYAYTDRKIVARGHIGIDKMALGNLLRHYPGVVETTLALPPRYWTKGEFMSAVKAEVAADVLGAAAERAITTVRAKQLGLYGGVRRRVGAIFALADVKHFKASWMEPVVPEAEPSDEVLGNAVHERVRKDRAETVTSGGRMRGTRDARRSDAIPFGLGGQLPQLQPNAADLKPTAPPDGTATGDRTVLE